MDNAKFYGDEGGPFHGGGWDGSDFHDNGRDN